MEKDCLPVPEDSRFSGESSTKEKSPKKKSFPPPSQPLNEV